MKNEIIFVLVVTAIAFVIFPKILKLVRGFRERFEGIVKDIPGVISIDQLKTMIKSAYKAQFGKFPTEKVLGEIIANNYPDSAGNQLSSAPVNLAASPAGALPAGAGALPAGAGALPAGAGASVASSEAADAADNNLAASAAAAQNDRLNIEELLKPRTSKAGDVTRSGNAINYSNNPELKSREGDIPIVGGSLLTSKGAAAATAIGGLNNKTPSPNLNIYPNITFIYAPSLEGRRSLPSQRPIKKRKERDYANYVQQQNTLGPSIVNSMGPPSSRPKGNGMTQFPAAVVKDFNSVWSGLK